MGLRRQQAATSQIDALPVRILPTAVGYKTMSLLSYNSLRAHVNTFAVLPDHLAHLRKRVCQNRDVSPFRMASISACAACSDTAAA